MSNGSSDSGGRCFAPSWPCVKNEVDSTLYVPPGALKHANCDVVVQCVGKVLELSESLMLGGSWWGRVRSKIYYMWGIGHGNELGPQLEWQCQYAHVLKV